MYEKNNRNDFGDCLPFGVVCCNNNADSPAEHEAVSADYGRVIDLAKEKIIRLRHLKSSGTSAFVRWRQLRIRDRLTLITTGISAFRPLR